MEPIRALPKCCSLSVSEGDLTALVSRAVCGDTGSPAGPPPILVGSPQNHVNGAQDVVFCSLVLPGWHDSSVVLDGKACELCSTRAVPDVTGPDFSGGPASLSCGVQKRRFWSIGTGGQGGSCVKPFLFLRLSVVACATSTCTVQCSGGFQNTTQSHTQRFLNCPALSWQAFGE